MKIECIKTYHLRCHLEQPFGFSQWYYNQRNVLIVQVIADNGESGWGECYGPADVIQAAVEKFYAPRLINGACMSTDALWHTMWRASLDFARGGVMTAAMSGIDMALWDLRGKALGQSVSQLMGGRLREQVPCYATGMYFLDLPEDQLLTHLVDEAKGYVDEGFRAMKIKVGKNPEFDIALIRAMRKAFPQMILAADSNHAYDLCEATKVAQVLDDCDYAWFEEPLSPEHSAQFRQLSDKCITPIATGECEQTRFGFQRLLKEGGVDIVQADLGYCGGPSEALKIRTLASSMGLNMIPHVWGTQFNLASACHFLATAYHEPGRREEKPLFLEYDRTENPLRDVIFTKQVDVSNGIATVPTDPGLGVEINENAMRSYVFAETETK
ncbi:mandelate racemase/muconate lactonizing enzyme family protein [Aestuariibacter sp. A3R04]|uniref:mandelate racemase/muconate lactonizing enzyme family protein n=1 Tax=Aestuariibacter sp. A3R04 TaxID=2841571 RepID=UPI001C097EF4|nr:mandelate racemase/muconate lactonizing enzyme family protein [Aestuariibacter sp. A3R04]MBU3021098.1 mandelate racemase/muconate lactonizing enzyme family protein [Aestuariibacter sp. A3R04]